MKLYKLINGIGTYWVIAEDPAKAERKLLVALTSHDYGFSDRRKVTEIHVVAEQITEGPLGISGKHLIL